MWAWGGGGKKAKINQYCKIPMPSSANVTKFTPYFPIT